MKLIPLTAISIECHINKNLRASLIFPFLYIRTATATLCRQEDLPGVAVSGCDVTATGTLHVVLYLAGKKTKGSEHVA